MDTLPTISPAVLPVLAKEVAFGYHDPEHLAREYNVPTPTLRALLTSPQFQHLVEKEQRSLTESGDRLRLTARKLLEEVLPDIAAITTDEDSPPAERIKAAESLAKWGGVVKETPENNIVIQIKGAEGLQALREQPYHNPAVATVTEFKPIEVQIPTPSPLPPIPVPEHFLPRETEGAINEGEPTLKR